MKKIDSLAGIRILATIMITLYHMEFFQLSKGITGRIHYSFSGFGSMGVALFIVMSGFLNMYNYRPDKFSKNEGEYIKHKVLKVYPLHVVTLTATMAFSIVSGQMTIPQCLARLFPQLLMIQAFIPVRSFYFSFNKLSWYLSLYLLFSIFDIYLLKWFAKKNRKQLTYLIIVTILFQTIWFSLFGGNKNAHWICYINPWFRLLDYILGICSGGIFKLCMDDSTNIRYRYGTIIEIAVLLLIFEVLPLKFVFGHEYYRLIYSVTAAFGIYIFALQMGKLSSFFGKTLLVKASSQTLSWYLIHQIVIHTVMLFFSNEWICFILTLIIVTASCFIWSTLMSKYKYYLSLL